MNIRILLLISIIAYTYTNTIDTNIGHIHVNTNDHSIKIGSGNVTIKTNPNSSLGKTRIRYVYLMKDEEDYTRMYTLYGPVSKEMGCSLTKTSLLCIIFGDQINKIDRKELENENTERNIVYNIDVKSRNSGGVFFLSFELTKNEGLDKQLLEIQPRLKKTQDKLTFLD